MGSGVLGRISIGPVGVGGASPGVSVFQAPGNASSQLTSNFVEERRAGFIRVGTQANLLHISVVKVTSDMALLRHIFHFCPRGTACPSSPRRARGGVFLVVVFVESDRSNPGVGHTPPEHGVNLGDSLRTRAMDVPECHPVDAVNPVLLLSRYAAHRVP